MDKKELEYAKEYAKLCNKYGYCIDSTSTVKIYELCSTSIIMNKDNIRYINDKISEDDIDLLEDVEESNIPPMEEGDLKVIFNEIDLTCDKLKHLTQKAKISTNLLKEATPNDTLNIASDKYMSEEGEALLDSI